MKNKNSWSGFTLIEIMIVVLIFMIMLTFIVINSNFKSNESVRVENAATTLLAKIKLAKQEAVLQHSNLRLIIEGNNYGFQKLQSKNNKYYWDWIKNDSLLGSVPMGKNISIANVKMLEIYPNGSFTPFNIAIKSLDGKSQFSLVGDDNGNIEIIKYEK